MDFSLSLFTVTSNLLIIFIIDLYENFRLFVFYISCLYHYYCTCKIISNQINIGYRRTIYA